MLPPYWDYRREYQELRDEILAAVDRVFKSGQLILGSEVGAFESAMAAYVGVAGGVVGNSGTDAIFIALSPRQACRAVTRSSPFRTPLFQRSRLSRFSAPARYSST